MTIDDRKFVRRTVFTVFGLYLFIGILAGGWKDLSLLWSGWMLLLLAELVMVFPQLDIISLRLNNEGKTLEVMLDFGFRLGFYFALLMSFSSAAYNGFLNSFSGLIAGLIFGGAMALTRYFQKPPNERHTQSSFLDLSQPASHALYTKLLYYIPPLIALFLFIFGPMIWGDQRGAWMGWMIILANIIPYYPYKFDWKNAPAISALNMLPTVLALALVLIANRMGV